MGRTANIVRNTKFGVIKTILSMIMQLFLRTSIIYILGVEYVGITSLYSNIIGCLGLAELGFGTAIVLSYYKPLANGDYKTICALNDYFKKIFFTISVIIMCLGCVLLPFLPRLINGDIPGNINIYVVYLILLANSVTSYFSAHRRALLFADQRNDIESKIKSVFVILLYTFQILLLFLFKNYYLYLILIPLFSIIESCVVMVFTNKFYKFLGEYSEKLSDNEKQEIKKNVKALCWHKLGAVLVTSTDNIIISVFLGLKNLGVYANYTVITTNVLLFIGMLIDAFQAPVGNLIASEVEEKVLKTYYASNLLFSWIIGFCTIAFFVLFQPFIVIWLRSSNLLLGLDTLLLICLSFYICNSVIAANIFKIGAGLVRYDYWKPIVQGIVNLVVSIILVKILGLNGIIIGTIVSFIVMPMWVEPYIIFKYLFKKRALRHYLQYIGNFVLTSIICLFTYFLCGLLPATGFWPFVFKVIICAIVPNVLFLAAYCWTPEFKDIVKTAKSFIKNFLDKRKGVEVAVAEETKENNMFDEEELKLDKVEDFVFDGEVDEVVNFETLIENKKDKKKESLNSLERLASEDDNEESLAVKEDTATEDEFLEEDEDDDLLTENEKSKNIKNKE